MKSNKERMEKLIGKLRGVRESFENSGIKIWKSLSKEELYNVGIFLVDNPELPTFENSWVTMPRKARQKSSKPISVKGEDLGQVISG